MFGNELDNTEDSPSSLMGEDTTMGPTDDGSQFDLFATINKDAESEREVEDNLGSVDISMDPVTTPVIEEPFNLKSAIDTSIAETEKVEQKEQEDSAILGGIDFSGERSSSVPQSSEGWTLDLGEKLKAAVDNTMGAAAGLGAAGLSAIDKGLDSIGMDPTSDLLNIEGGRDGLIEYAQNQFEKAADRGIVSQKFTEISDPIEFGKWAVDGMISVMPDMAFTVITGGVGSLAAGASVAAKAGAKSYFKKRVASEVLKLTAKGVAKKEAGALATKVVASEIGASTGVFMYTAGSATGRSYLNAVELVGVDEANPLYAAINGAVQGSIAVLNPLNKFLTGTVTGKAYLASGKKVLAMTFGEAAEEMSQELSDVVHDSAIDPNMSISDALSDPETWERVLESGILGAFMGGLTSGPSVINKARVERKASAEDAAAKKVLEEAGINSTSTTDGADLESKLDAVGLSTPVSDPGIISDLEVFENDRKVAQALESEGIPSVSNKVSNEELDTEFNKYKPTAPTTPVAPLELNTQEAYDKYNPDVPGSKKIPSEQAFIDESDVQTFISEVDKYKKDWQQKNVSLADTKVAAGQLADAMSKSFNEPGKSGLSSNIQTLIMNRVVNSRIDSTMSESTTAAGKKAASDAKKVLQSKEGKKAEEIIRKYEGLDSYTGKVEAKPISSTEVTGDVTFDDGKLAASTASTEQVYESKVEAGPKPKAMTAKEAKAEIETEGSTYVKKLRKDHAKTEEPEVVAAAEALLLGDKDTLSTVLDEYGPKSRKNILIRAGEVAVKVVGNENLNRSGLVNSLVDAKDLYGTKNKTKAEKGLRVISKSDVESVLEDVEGNTWSITKVNSGDYRLQMEGKDDVATFKTFGEAKTFLLNRNKSILKEKGKLGVKTKKDKAKTTKVRQSEKSKRRLERAKKQEKAQSEREKSRKLKSGEKRQEPSPVKSIKVSEEEKAAIIKRANEARKKSTKSNSEIEADEKRAAKTESRASTVSEGKIKEERSEYQGSWMDKYKTKDVQKALEYGVRVFGAANKNLAALELFDSENKKGENSGVRRYLKEAIVKFAETDEVHAKRMEEKFPTVDAALDHILDNGSRAEKALVRLIRTIANNKKLSSIKIKGLKSSQSSYYSNGTVYLSSDSTTIVLHEIVHAITVKELAKNKQLSRVLKSLMDDVGLQLVKDGVVSKTELDQISGMNSKQIKRWAESKGMSTASSNFSMIYALSNEREFLAQTFSSKTFQDFLRKIEVDAPPTGRVAWIKNAWDMMVSIVGTALKLNPSKYTALDKALTLTAELVQSTDVSGSNVNTGISESPNIDKKSGPDNDTRTYEEKTSDHEDLIRSSSEKVGSSKGKYESFFKGVKGLFDDVALPLTEQLDGINKKLTSYMRRMESAILQKNKEYAKNIKPFLRKMKDSDMDKGDETILTYYLFNTRDGDMESSNRIMEKYDLLEEYKKVDKTLREILKRQQEVGINLHIDSNSWYFPRKVKDVDGLRDELYKKYQKSGFPGPLGVIMADENLSEAEKKAKLTTIFNSGTFMEYALKLPGSARDRSVGEVHPTFLKYYHDIGTSLSMHIAESNEKIEGRVLLGGKTGASMLRAKYKKLSKDITKAEEDGRSTTKLLEKMMDLENKLGGLDEVSDNAVSEFLVNSKLDLSLEDQRKTIRLIRARLNQKGMHGAMGDFRNVTLAAVLGSPLNALTQLGDLVWTLHKNGLINTSKAIFGSKLYTRDDLDFTQALTEFTDAGTGTNQILDKVLGITGFKRMDQFGKEVSMQASLNRVKSRGKADFIKSWGAIFDTEVDAEQVYNDIVAGKKTKDVAYFVFTDISKFQPVSLSEMPRAYLEAGNGRVFYTLKSYSIKALSNLRNEYKDTSKSKAKRLASLSKLVLLLTFANASIDELKDILMGTDDEEDFTDKLIDNMLNLFFMSRYSVEKGLRGKPIHTFLSDTLLPPTILDEPLTDLYNLVNPNKEATLGTLRYVPLVGQVIKKSTLLLGDKKHQEKQRTYIQDLIKEDRKVSKKTRGLINKYNASIRKQSDLKGKERGKLMIKSSDISRWRKST